MVEGQALPAVEDDPEGVAGSADQQPDKEIARVGGQDRFDGYNRHPAHQQVKDDREAAQFAGKEELEGDARRGHDPDREEERFSPAVGEEDQREGGVGARDQQVDRGVVHYPERPLDPFVPEPVVEHGGGVEDDQGAPEEEERGPVPGVADAAGDGDEEAQHPEGEECPQPVGDGVGDLLGEGLGAVEEGFGFGHGRELRQISCNKDTVKPANAGAEKQ